MNLFAARPGIYTFRYFFPVGAQEASTGFRFNFKICEAFKMFIGWIFLLLLLCSLKHIFNDYYFLKKYN